MTLMMKTTAAVTALVAAMAVSGTTAMADAQTKANAVTLLQQGLAQNDVALINDLVAEDYIQHNPIAPDGRVGLLGFAGYLQSLEMPILVNPVRVLQEGNLVVVHSEFDIAGKQAIFDLFRVEDGKFVEHWDGIQDIPAETASGRSMIDGPTEIMGGAIAQIMASENEGQFKQFVLVDTTPQLVASDTFEHALPSEAAQQLGGLLAENFAQRCGAFCGMIAPENEAVAARLTSIAVSTDIAVAMTAFVSSGGRNQLAELSSITAPTTIICGRNDAICMSGASEFMANAIPGCITDVVWIEGAGQTSPTSRLSAGVGIISAQSWTITAVTSSRGSSAPTCGLVM